MLTSPTFPLNPSDTLQIIKEQNKRSRMDIASNRGKVANVLHESVEVMPKHNWERQ